MPEVARVAESTDESHGLLFAGTPGLNLTSQV